MHGCWGCLSKLPVEMVMSALELSLTPPGRHSELGFSHGAKPNPSGEALGAKPNPSGEALGARLRP